MYYVYCVTCTVITFLSQIKYFKQNLQCISPIVKAIFFLIKREDLQIKRKKMQEKGKIASFSIFSFLSFAHKF